MNSANCEQTTTTTAATTPSTSNVTSTTTSTSSEQPKTKDDEDSLPDFHWLVRPCFLYDEEYSDCRSFKARFHQYFIYGESLDCSQWKADYDNCSQWEKKKDKEALKKVIESEKTRIRTRLQGHYANDIWENRKEPPSDWNKELPEHILEEYKTSYLKEKADAIKEGKEELGSVDKNIRDAAFFDAEEVSRCVIV